MKKSIIVYVVTVNGDVITSLKPLKEALSKNRDLNESALCDMHDKHRGHLYVLRYPEGTDIKTELNVVTNVVNANLPEGHKALTYEGEYL